MVEKKVKKTHKNKKKMYIEKLCVFENISVSDYDQESISSSSSEGVC